MGRYSFVPLVIIIASGCTQTEKKIPADSPKEAVEYGFSLCGFQPRLATIKEILAVVDIAVPYTDKILKITELGCKLLQKPTTKGAVPELTVVGKDGKEHIIPLYGQKK